MTERTNYTIDEFIEETRKRAKALEGAISALRGDLSSVNAQIREAEHQLQALMAVLDMFADDAESAREHLAAVTSSLTSGGGNG